MDEFCSCGTAEIPQVDSRHGTRSENPGLGTVPDLYRCDTPGGEGCYTDYRFSLQQLPKKGHFLKEMPKKKS